MKILVTGASGYLGQGVVTELLNNGHVVIANDITTGNVDHRAVFMKADIFAIDDPYQYFDKPDAVVHMAWRDGFKHNSKTHIIDLPRHFHFMEKLIDAGIENLTVMGSMHEIGFWEGSINENTPCNPMNIYGVTKNALREALNVITAGKSICLKWLRAYYIVGNAAYGSSIFSKLYAAANSGQQEYPFTTGLNQYDFISYENFCAQVAAAVDQTEVDGIINICSGYPQKLSECVERFIVDNHLTIKLKYGAFPDRPYDSKAVWGNPQKIQMIMKNKGV